jgi:hypothetical protein
LLPAAGSHCPARLLLAGHCAGLLRDHPGQLWPRKRQVPVVGGGAGVWSLIEITDAAAATLAAVGRGEPGV